MTRSLRQMTKIFFSYRREDSADVAGRIFDHLWGLICIQAASRHEVGDTHASYHGA